MGKKNKKSKKDLTNNETSRVSEEIMEEMEKLKAKEAKKAAKAEKKAAKKAAKKQAEAPAPEKKSKKDKKKKQDKGDLTPPVDKKPSKSDVFSGNYKEFLDIMRSYPSIPTGGEAVDHFIETEHGQIRVRVNPDMSNGKSGRRSVQLNGKQLTAPQQKALFSGSGTSTEVAQNAGVGPTDEMLANTYKKKALITQLNLMQKWPEDDVEESFEAFGKKISGEQIRVSLVEDFSATPTEIKDVLEALCR